MGIKTFLQKYVLLFSLILTIMMVAAIDFFQIPNPNVILITVIVYLTFIGGTVSGSLSALIVIIYSLYFFSVPYRLGQYTPENLKKVLVIIIFIPIMVVIVGRLKRQLVLKSKELQSVNQELIQIARADPLTGIANRRFFDEVFLKEFNGSAREQNPISLLMVDIDFFKKYNDCYGYLAGDNCLKKVAQAVSEEVHRPGDFIARFGGEEFIVILPHTNTKGAMLIGNRIIESVDNMHIEHRTSKTSPYVTVSVGVSTLTSFQGGDPINLIECADKALYRAKENGRNQSAVCCDGEFLS